MGTRRRTKLEIIFYLIKQINKYNIKAVSLTTNGGSWVQNLVRKYRFRRKIVGLFMSVPSIN